MEYSKALTFIRNRFLGMALFQKIFLQDIEAEKREAMKVVDALILEFKELSADNGAVFVLVVVPDKMQVQNKGNINMMEIDHLKVFGPEHGIQTIVLLPYLRMPENMYRAYFKFDGHFSPEGHQLVGEVLAKELKERGILAG